MSILIHFILYLSHLGLSGNSFHSGLHNCGLKSLNDLVDDGILKNIGTLSLSRNNIQHVAGFVLWQGSAWEHCQTH